MRKKIDGGLSLTTLENLLKNTKDPKSFTRLRMCSKPIYKKSFLKYLQFIKAKSFVEWEKCGDKTNAQVIYRLSQRGRVFLELVQ